MNWVGNCMVRVFEPETTGCWCWCPNYPWHDLLWASMSCPHLPWPMLTYPDLPWLALISPDLPWPAWTALTWPDLTCPDLPCLPWPVQTCHDLPQPVHPTLTNLTCPVLLFPTLIWTDSITRMNTEQDGVSWAGAKILLTFCLFRYFGSKLSEACEHLWQCEWTPPQQLLVYFQMFYYNLTMSKWSRSGAAEKPRCTDEFNMSLYSWELVGVCWWWLDPSHYRSWRVICKLVIDWTLNKMLSRSEEDATSLLDSMFILVFYHGFEPQHQEQAGETGHGAGAEGHHVIDIMSEGLWSQSFHCGSIIIV